MTTDDTQRPGFGALCITVLEGLGPYLGLALVIGAFGAADPRLLQAEMLVTVFLQNLYVVLCALGMTFVIVSGGIDLSVGAVLALASVVTAWALREGWPVPLAYAAGIGSGALCGAINGLLIVGLRLVPFIATLGMMGIARGLAKWLAGLETVNPGLDHPGFTFLEGLLIDAWWSPALWLTLALAAFAAAMLKRSVFGLQVTAIGSNLETARLCGVPVERRQLQVYTLSGLTAGLGGVALFGRLGLGDPTGGVAAELDVIAAAVIGGASLAGGVGSIAGAVAGALLMGVLDTGCVLLGWKVYVREVLTGAIIVAAVALDALRDRSA